MENGPRKFTPVQREHAPTPEKKPPAEIACSITYDRLEERHEGLRLIVQAAISGLKRRKTKAWTQQILEAALYDDDHAAR